MNITGDILVGAQRVPGGERSFRAVNPATGESLEPAFAFAGRAEVERACALAWEAFHLYRETGLEERAQFLETIAANIVDIGDALIERASAETGLPRGRIQGERARTVGQLKLSPRLRARVSGSTFASTAPCPSASPCRG
jgi:2,5-dioxopentanoate dehydrogenase